MIEIKGISPELSSAIVALLLVVFNAAYAAISSFNGGQLDWAVVNSSVLFAAGNYLTNKYHDNRLSPKAAAKATKQLAQPVTLEQ